MTLTGWGRTAWAGVTAARPERIRDVYEILGDVGDDGLIVHGAGRSYGDVALNRDGRVLLSERLDRILAFDEATGEIVCEAGVTFAELIETFLPRGFLVPVAPGTSFATVGGAVANDVHGKNHDRVGSFGDHVRWFEMALPDGQLIRVDPDTQPGLFAATVGGLGLTGVLLTVCFRMVTVPSARMEVEESRIPDLDAFLDALVAVRETADYSVGWIDALASGASLGRGILQTAFFKTDAPATFRPRRRISVPADLPGWVLNPVTVSTFNRFYFRRVPEEGRTGERAADAFLFPLDAVGRWNRIYGRRGFYQFQCVIPDDAAGDGIRKLLEIASSARAGSFLAVLKTLGGEGRGFLSFPMRGVTLALDFPARRGVRELLHRLTDITMLHGGRVYLAKDAVLTPEQFSEMYPRLDDFRAVLRDVDPDGRMRSDLSRRLYIRGAGECRATAGSSWAHPPA